MWGAASLRWRGLTVIADAPTTTARALAGRICAALDGWHGSRVAPDRVVAFRLDELTTRCVVPVLLRADGDPGLDAAIEARLLPAVAGPSPVRH
jgi:hypothetical protein